MLILQKLIGIVQKVFSGEGVGNSQNASEMRQKCVKNAQAKPWLLSSPRLG